MACSTRSHLGAGVPSEVLRHRRPKREWLVSHGARGRPSPAKGCSGNPSVVVRAADTVVQRTPAREKER